MRERIQALTAILFSIALLPAASPAQESTSTVPGSEVSPMPSPSVTPRTGELVRPQRVTPLVSELLLAVEQERLAIAELRASMGLTREPARLLELQRQIESVKRETEQTLLRIQIEHARREGRLQVAEELEAALLRMSTASVLPAPALRTRTP